MKTGVNATRLAIAGFIIPFIFAMSPDMLLVNTTWYEVLLITVTSVIGMYGVTYGLISIGIGAVFAKAVSSLIGFFGNYLLRRYFVFFLRSGK